MSDEKMLSRVRELLSDLSIADEWEFCDMDRRTLNEAADLIDQQAARVDELEAALEAIAELRYSEAGEPLDDACKLASDALSGDGRLSQLRSRIAELEAEREWRPIETAPKDGTVIEIWTSEGLGSARWAEQQQDAPDQPGHDAGWEGWTCSGGCIWPGREADDHYRTPPDLQPTHWRPESEPPEEPSE